MTPLELIGVVWGGVCVFMLTLAWLMGRLSERRERRARLRVLDEELAWERDLLREPSERLLKLVEIHDDWSWPR